MACVDKQVEVYLKFLLCGHSEVGKRSILWRYFEKTSPSERPWSFLAPFPGETIIKRIPIGEEIVTLKFSVLLPERHTGVVHDVDLDAYRGCSGFMVVYDITDLQSFLKAKFWIEEVQMYSAYSYCYTCPNIVLVGNKSDLEAEREIQWQDGEKMANAFDIPFIEISAKTGEHIDKAFVALLRRALEDRGRSDLNCKYLLSPLGRKFYEVMSHVADLDKKNTRMASTIKNLPKEIKIAHIREKGASKGAKSYEKKAIALRKQIEKDTKSFALVANRREQTRDRADTLEQRVRVFQNRVSNLQLRVQQVEGRVADLERQLRRAEGKEEHQFEKYTNSWVVQKEEIELTDEELGRGRWTMVYIAKFRGLKVAAKCMQSLTVSDYNRQLFSREMIIAAIARHPNLIQFIGAMIEGQPIILTELMSTSLRAELEKQPLSPDQISSISLDVARALLYLHLMRPDPIIHRDISSANVLLNPGPNNSWLAKVSDYGSANYLRQVTTQGPGNPSYAAPEANVPSQHNPRMDVYSYGALLLEMWTQQFPDKTKHRALLQGVEQEEVREMVQRCLEQDPLQRPEMRDIVEQLQ